MSESKVTRFEQLLGTARGRALLTLSLVAVVSLVTTAPHVETADLRGRDVDLVEIYFEQFLIWAAWGFVAWPMLAFASWLNRRTRSWLVFVLVLVPTSLLTSYGFLQLDYYVHKPSEAEVEEWREEWQRMRAQRREESGSERGPGGRRDDGPGRRGDPRDRARDEEGARDGRPPRPNRGMDRLWNRQRAMRAGMESPDLALMHWRFRWIENALIFWSLLGLGGGLAAFLGLRRKERLTAELELRSSELRGELAQANLDTLKGQLQPHFLFNALHSVGGLIRAGEQQLALKTLSAIGQLLRSTLDLDGTAEIRLEQELKIAASYVEIEQIRFGDRLRVEVDSSAELAGALIPTLLLLPLVENAVKYGVAPQTSGGSLAIRVRRDGESLELTVQDDGQGFPESILSGESSSAARRSIGLENTRARLHALYGASQSFELCNPEGGGALVRVSLPYHTEPAEDPRTESHD